MFGRATIRLGIGPHSSFLWFIDGMQLQHTAGRICTMFAFACLRSDRNKERSRQAANFLTADDINTGDGTQWNSALRHATLKASMYATVLRTYSQKTKVKAAASLEIL